MMSDHENDRNAKRPLSEISHLFLSGIREQAGENRVRPVRTPPTMRAATPELAKPTLRSVEPIPAIDEVTIGGTPDASRRKRVTAVVGATVTGESLGDAALAYAASLAASDQRIGVMTIDANLFRLQVVACDADGEESSDVESLDRLDLREASAAVLEMNHDVDRWLLVIGDVRRAEARSILRQSDDWTMLCTCDHDGIVSGYRTLKGLAEGEKSPLSIAVVDAPDDMQARKVFEKLAGVCRQFLDWDVEHEMLEADVEHARVRTILRAAPAGRMTAHWAAVEHLLALEPDRAADDAHYGPTDEELSTLEAPTMSIPRLAQPIHAEISAAKVEAIAKPEEKPMPVAAPAVVPTFMSIAPVIVAADEVIDLPDGTSVMQAVLKAGTQLLATPIAPPMCVDATVTVGRDRGLVLVAQAQAGLAGVDSIASAVRWLDDSKQLIAMAMPQLAIDVAAPTRVLLLVDQADRAAVAVRPLFAGSDGRVTVRSYRRLRWAGRTGLLLDAA